MERTDDREESGRVRSAASRNPHTDPSKQGTVSFSTAQPTLSRRMYLSKRNPLDDCGLTFARPVLPPVRKPRAIALAASFRDITRALLFPRRWHPVASSSFVRQKSPGGKLTCANWSFVRLARCAGSSSGHRVRHFLASDRGRREDRRFGASTGGLNAPGGSNFHGKSGIFPSVPLFEPGHSLPFTACLGLL